MCWSLEASAAITTLGFGATVLAIVRKDPPAVWMTLGYFSLMEALQAVTYVVVNACGTPANQIVTLLAYLHIAFQPFFVNLISLSFIPETVRTRAAPVVYGLCFVSAAVMILQLFPFAGATPCKVGDVLCGRQLCAITGTWHIGWEVPSSSISSIAAFPTYLFVVFVVPVVYGSWRFTLFHFVTGPAAAYLTTRNPNEFPAVWCLFSLGLLLVVMTPLRQQFAVTKWIIWPARWRAAIG